MDRILTLKFSYYSWFRKSPGLFMRGKKAHKEEKNDLALIIFNKCVQSPVTMN